VCTRSAPPLRGDAALSHDAERRQRLSAFLLLPQTEGEPSRNEKVNDLRASLAIIDAGSLEDQQEHCHRHDKDELANRVEPKDAVYEAALLSCPRPALSDGG